MTVKRPQLLRFMAVLLALALPVLFAACGGDEDETTTAADTPDQTQTDTSSDDGGNGSSGKNTEETLKDPRGNKPPRPIGERDDPPKVPEGSDDSIQTFGEEADDEQAALIAESARGFFKAQAKKNWADACFYLSTDVKDQFAQIASQAPEPVPTDCPSLLEQLGQGVPNSARKQAAKVRVRNVRVEDEQAFVLYIGARRDWYAVPVREEDSGWKVGAMAGVPIYSG